MAFRSLHTMGLCGSPRQLCRRRQARTREQPATETLIVVAVGRACGTILLARSINQTANLAGRCSERTLMMARLMTRHGSDQEFEVVGHIVLRVRRGERCNNGRTRRLRILIKDVQKYIML